jgi:class 3 adenylate cyclase
VLADHHQIIRESLQNYDGHEVGTQGDAFFATFTSTRACVASAVAMQRTLSEQSWPSGEDLKVRMGIHTGEAWTTRRARISSSMTDVATRRVIASIAEAYVRLAMPSRPVTP